MTKYKHIMQIKDLKKKFTPGTKSKIPETGSIVESQKTVVRSFPI
jgi:hypothetical protein